MYVNAFTHARALQYDYCHFKTAIAYSDDHIVYNLQSLSSTSVYDNTCPVRWPSYTTILALIPMGISKIDHQELTRS